MKGSCAFYPEMHQNTEPKHQLKFGATVTMRPQNNTGCPTDTDNKRRRLPATDLQQVFFP